MSIRLEGEIETRGTRMRCRMRLVEDDFVIAVFSRDYPSHQPASSIVNDLAAAFEQQQPGAAELLRKAHITKLLLW